jgi:CHAT domain-containing protein
LSQTINLGLSDNPTFIAYQYADRTLELPYSSRAIKLLKPIWQNLTVRYVDDLPNPKNTLVQDMANCDILHLSLHASSSSTDKLENTIYLKAGLREPLHGFELLDKRVKARLIVLSACESAKGETKTGEGVFSLSRSFIQIGATCLISSFWKNDDAATSLLLSHFYTTLHQKVPIIRALQAAKIQLAKDKNSIFNSPKFWAGMNIIY